MLKPKNKGWRLLTLPAILLLILLVVAVAACTGDGNGDSTGTEHGTPTRPQLLPELPEHSPKVRLRPQPIHPPIPDSPGRPPSLQRSRRHPRSACG